MIKIRHNLIRNQIQIDELICCDCYFDLSFFLLRRKVNFDEMHNWFNNLSNCYYAVAYNAMIGSCYKFLRFEIHNNKDKFVGRNCFQNISQTK